MPLMIFEGPPMPVEKKRELVREVTEAVHRVTGHPKHILTVVIHENGPENVGAGGELLVDRWAREADA